MFMGESGQSKNPDRTVHIKVIPRKMKSFLEQIFMTGS
jgi:hypothetical protein